MSDHASSNQSMISWALVGYVLLIVIAGVMHQKSDPKTLRPARDGTAPERVRIEGHVEARLWQDPLEAAWAFVSPSMGVNRMDHEKQLRAEWMSGGFRSKNWSSTKGSQQKRGYIAIILDGKATGSSHEGRVRARYAVQEAMKACQYVPVNYDEIGVVPVPIKRANEGAAGTQNPEADNQREDGRSPPQGEIVQPSDLANLKSATWFPLAYEGFKSESEESADSLLILWVDSKMVDLEGSRGYDLIESVLTEKFDFGSNAEDTKNGDFLCVIDMGGSERLKNVISSLEAPAKGGPRGNGNREVVFPKATAPVRDLLDDTQGSARDKKLGRQASSSEENAVSSVPWTVYRDTPNDSVLLKVLYDELSLRVSTVRSKGGTKADNSGNRVDSTGNKTPGESDPKEIWIICEQDTLYSRSMSQSFNSLVQGHLPDGSVVVRSFEYLKGVDGDLPAEEGGSAPGQQSQLDPMALLQALSQGDPDAGRIFDRRQVDYIERLADRLKEREMRKRRPFRSAGGVVAIGVLGSDIYDKLLVLQIFRDRFPAVVFFTTEIDVAYLHPLVSNFTRSLIVASPWGLSPLCESGEVDECECEPQASCAAATEVVFRDDHQTALFSTIVRNRRIFENGPKAGDSTRYRETLPPIGGSDAEVNHEMEDPLIRCFEVGRTRFVELEARREKVDEEREISELVNGQVAEGDSEEEIDERPVVERPPSDWSPGAWDWAYLVTRGKRFLLMVLGLLVGLASVVGVQWLMDQKEGWPGGGGRSRGAGPDESGGDSWAGVDGLRGVWQVFLWVAVAVVSFVSILVIPLHSAVASGGLLLGEPMYWFEGVSAWPSILIRFLLWAFGIWSLAWNFREGRRVMSGMQDEGAASVVFEGILGRVEGRSILWKILHVFLVSSVFLLMLLLLKEALVFLSDDVFAPIRGRVVRNIHIVTIMLVVPMMIFAIWWSLLRHQECRRVMEVLASRISSKGMVIDETRQGGERKEDCLTEDEVKWLNRYADSVSATLFPPFTMMVLLIASRHRIFDAWNFPLVLAVFFAIMLSVLLAASLRLSRSAIRLRDRDLEVRREIEEKDETKRENLQIASIWARSSGPFGKLRQQPVIQALLISTAGLGLVSFEPLFRLFMR